MIGYLSGISEEADIEDAIGIMRTEVSYDPGSPLILQGVIDDIEKRYGKNPLLDEIREQILKVTGKGELIQLLIDYPSLLRTIRSASIPRITKRPILTPKELCSELKDGPFQKYKTEIIPARGTYGRCLIWVQIGRYQSLYDPIDAYRSPKADDDTLVPIEENPHETYEREKQSREAVEEYETEEEIV